MKNIFTGLLFGVIFSSAGMAAQPLDIKEMDGETQLSCSAILCLASATRPAECMPPINHYFSIVRQKFWETLQARLDFLNLCPVDGASGMDSMKAVIVRGAGNCDAASLNVSQYVSGPKGNDGRVMNNMPDYCSAYFNHQYVRLDPPRYVGTPDRGGFWVDVKDYEVALSAYTARWAEIDRRRGLLNEGSD